MASDGNRGVDLDVHLYEDVDLSGAAVVDGFPSVGLVSTICANYLIDLLDLEQVGILDAPAFPTVSIVRDGEPMFPVRIYASEQVCVFVSEFQPDKHLVRPIAETILDFALEHDSQLVVSPEGLVTDEETDEEDEDVEVYGLASTSELRDKLDAADLQTFSNGIITGVSGVLLSLGKREDMPSLSLLAEANPNYPDARAAARVIEAVDDLLDHVDIEVKPLYTEAENIERTLRMMQKQAGAGAGQPDEHPMYGGRARRRPAAPDGRIVTRCLRARRGPRGGCRTSPRCALASRRRRACSRGARTCGVDRTSRRCSCRAWRTRCMRQPRLM
ncbi:proteasome assembly chaperone family protein [Thermoplasmatales archaeon SW_10_69_26]|nr:MAG: proteasome assembly chaperone family protein [Thermoplasmatales archaeon SW_10_69_26]